MKTPTYSAAHAETPIESGESSSYHPGSASIIHNVVNRRGSDTAMLDREATLREEVEKQHFSLLLRSLHDIADEKVPDAMRRLVRESEVQRAVAVVRRFKLLHPQVTLDRLLEHCERAAAAENDAIAHLVDPLQLRHMLTYHDNIPHEELTALELYELDRAVEHGPDAEITEWFASIDPKHRALPSSTPGYLRTIFLRACRSGVPASRLGILSFESAVLTLRTQGVIGFEDTRLHFSLIKQIAGEEIPGLESYLESGDTHHAAAQHRAAGNSRPAEYFRQLANFFDHTALPNLEQRVIKIAAERSAAHSAAAVPTPAPATVAPTTPRRGFLTNLFGLGQSLFARG